MCLKSSKKAKKVVTKLNPLQVGYLHCILAKASWIIMSHKKTIIALMSST